MLGNDDFTKVIFSGDATIHTFYQMYKDNENDKERVSVYADSVWTAPHHGAFKTIEGNFSESDTKELFSLFMEQVEPRGMVVSSGVQNKYGHPCLEFVSRALYVLPELSEDDRHYIYFNYSNNEGNDSQWMAYKTQKSLYTLVEPNPSKFSDIEEIGIGACPEDICEYKCRQVTYFQPPQQQSPSPPNITFNANHHSHSFKQEMPSKNLFFHRI
jgi:hypothetical protein